MNLSLSQPGSAIVLECRTDRRLPSPPTTSATPSRPNDQLLKAIDYPRPVCLAPWRAGRLATSNQS